MTLTADQYLQLATSYDDAARDPSIAPEKREAFAKKGRWFRFLAAREGDILELKEPLSEDRIDSAQRRGLGPFLTTLWLSGAAIYLLCTVLLTDTVTNFFSSETREALVADRPVASLDTAKSKDEIAGLRPGVPLAKRSQAHAIDPNEPPYEAPGLVIPPSTTEASQKTEASPNPITAVLPDQNSTPLANEPEVRRLSASATIRNGPSPDAKVIGTARPGAELEVKTRENGWVQFVDPSSGNSGWIESRLLVSASPDTTTVEPTNPQEAQAPSVEQPNPKAVKKRVRTKATEPAQVAKQQRLMRPSPPARNRAHAGLPDDEAFIDTRIPRRGFFARRRMLREGLLSPDFSPP